MVTEEMSPVPPTDAEAAPPLESEGGNAAEHAVVPPEEVSSAPPAPATTDGGPTTPAPTKVDAYKPRGIGRGKHNPLNLAPVLLRFLTAVFSLISFAIIASASSSIYISFSSINLVGNIQFNAMFFLSYLLTVNVLAFSYAIVTTVLSFVLLTKSCPSAVFIVVFVLDQIMSYLLMSASTSAATGIRTERNSLESSSHAEYSFLSKSYASITFSFLAFFVLASAAVISGLRAARRT